MQYLTKFLEYLKESEDKSTEEIEVMLLPFEDIGVRCRVLAKSTITEGVYKGRIASHIMLEINFKKNYQSMIDDDRYWIFLDELLSFKARLESDNVSINSNWCGDNRESRIRITYIESSSESGDILELKTMYNKIQNKYRSGRSDFSNGITIDEDFKNKKFIVHCGNFTSRKWKLFIKDMDISNFDMSVKMLGEPRKSSFPFENEIINPDADVIFTLKNT